MESVLAPSSQSWLVYNTSSAISTSDLSHFQDKITAELGNMQRKVNDIDKLVGHDQNQYEPLYLHGI